MKSLLLFVYYDENIEDTINFLKKIEFKNLNHKKIKFDKYYSSPNRVKEIEKLNYNYIKHDNKFLDWSGYMSAEKLIKKRKYSFCMFFNDTLVKKRYFGFFFSVWLNMGINLFLKEKIDLACPYDSDNENSWMCSYLFLVKPEIINDYFKQIKLNNFLNILNKHEKNRIDNWINKSWRRSDYADKTTKLKKKNSIFIEKSFLKSIYISKIFKYKKISFFRIMNSIERRILK